jgi:predicted ribosome quality control (RQC) complex YloA/Tae2 family protein
MKFSLNALDLLALSTELQSLLSDTYVDNVYHLNDTVVFKFRNRSGEKLDLRIDIGKWVRITSYVFEPPKEISNWCRIMRSKLINLSVKTITQPSFDRLLEITFDNDYKMYLELMDNGNIILVQPDNVISVVYKSKETKDRSLKPGASYKMPPKKWFDPLKADINQVLNALIASKGNIVQSLVKFLGIPAEVADEIVLRSNMAKDYPVSKLEYSHIVNFLNVFKELYECSKNAKYPAIVWSDKEPISVIPCMFEIYKNYKIVHYSTFNNAVDEYAHVVLSIESELERRANIEREKNRLLATILEQEKQANVYSKEAKELRFLASLIQSHITDIELYINNLKSSGFKDNWKADLELLLPGFKILGYDQKSRSILIGMNELQIPIKLDWSIGKNIENIFNLAKESERKFKRTLESIEELKLKIREIDSQLSVPSLIPVIRKPPSFWYENFHFFRSSDGFLVIGGKDASQNESLIKRRMENDDIVVHADIHGSPFVIIKNARKSLPQKTIEEACQFTVSFSRAWNLGLATADAYWVYPEQVSKKAPSGTYLKPGSFMIYGQRNYIKNVQLKLAVALFFDEGWAKFYISPIDPIKILTDTFVEITPGEISRNDAAKQIVTFFYKNKENEIKKAPNRKNLVNELIERLPKGGFNLIFHK